MVKGNFNLRGVSKYYISMFCECFRNVYIAFVVLGGGVLWDTTYLGLGFRINVLLVFVNCRKWLTPCSLSWNVNSR